MRVAFATCAALADGHDDDWAAAVLLDAAFLVWNDPTVDWRSYDRVVIRTIWDYTAQPEAFLRWCHYIGPERLRNPPDVIAFNLDKRYLGELAVPTIPTTFVTADDPLPPLAGEMIVKPSISAGARNTGRFGPRTYADADALIRRITASGRAALVQPYMPAVDAGGETAMVYFNGVFSHAMHKRAVLRPDEIAPVAPGHPTGVAAVMLEPDLVIPAGASAAERSLGDAVQHELHTRFGTTPLYCRVDTVPNLDGEPLVLEVELIEPSLFLRADQGAAVRFAAALRDR